MRILLLDVNCKYSSTGKIVYDLYTNLRKEGHQAAVCYGRGDKINEPDIYKFGLDWETYLHAALARVTGLNGYFSPLSTRRLIKFIEDYKPDIIHIHELHAYFVNLKPLLQYIKKKGIKVIWTFHCEYMYTGKCGHAYDCEKWKSECGDCPAVKEYPKSLFVDGTKFMFKEKKRLLQDLDMTIVTPSKWLADRVKQSFLSEKRVEVVHNGIDEEIFHPVEAGEMRERLDIPKENRIVLAVAPNIMSETKGGKWIVELAGRMREKAITFVLVGTNGEIGQKDNVIFVNKTANQSELATYYSMADLFVICSKKETFSLTCAESLMCGTPIVGFEAGAPETVFEKPYAIFTPYGDLELLQKTACDVLENDNGEREQISEAHQKFSKKEMIGRYMKLYDEACESVK